MKITGGWIDGLLIGSGINNYEDLQQHTWHIVGSTLRDIDNTFQPIDATWSVTGGGSADDGTYAYSWIRQVTGVDAPLEVRIDSQDNLVHLARSTTAWNYPDGVTGTQTKHGGQPVTDGYQQFEIPLPSLLTQWSPNLTGSFVWPYQRVDVIKIGGKIYKLKLPNRGVRDPNPVSTGWLWQPGPPDSRYFGFWHWEIDFA